MTLVNFIVLALATWRISSILVYEEGPFDICARFRNAIGVKYDSHAHTYGENMLANLFTCLWCLSIWVGIAIAAFYVLVGDIAVVACLPFALSAVAVIIHTNTEEY